MTEAIYLEVTEMEETAHKAKRQVSVSGMLKHLYKLRNQSADIITLAKRTA